MAGFREKLAHAIPWIEPVIEYFDWRKRLVALVAGAAIAGWSFVKDLPWPVIVTLGLGTIVIVAYGSVFPAFLKLVHVGVNPRPNYSIWKHKKRFSLLQAAYLLADREPTMNPAGIDGDAAAWYEVLREAIAQNELKRIPLDSDGQFTKAHGRFSPQPFTPVRADALKEFCASKGRNPEFLGD